jgi:4-carboxymuconolactone decarboxylase
MTDRAALRDRGHALRRTLFGSDASDGALATPVAGFDDLMAELVYGGIWSRPGLARPERMACTLAALCAVQNLEALRAHVGAALALGLSPNTIVEIFVQDGIYRGFPASEAALRVARAAFAARGVAVADADDPVVSLDALAALGKDVQAALHGARKDDGHAAPDHPVTGSIYPLIVQHCYGTIWHRPGLDRRIRALCAVAAFTVLGRDALLRKFALSALNVGATRTEVIEAAIQTGPYGGFAFMLNALSQIGEAFGAA